MFPSKPQIQSTSKKVSKQSVSSQCLFLFSSSTFQLGLNQIKLNRKDEKFFCCYSTQLKWICNKLFEIALSDMSHRMDIEKRESGAFSTSHAIDVYKFCITFECENILKHWISITNFKPIYLTFWCLNGLDGKRRNRIRRRDFLRLFWVPRAIE